MHISVKWFGNQFNVNIAKKEGEQEFLSVKGCRIANGQNGEFVSYPSQKNEQTGKWWNHVWGDDNFNAYVLKLAKDSQPQQQAKPMADDSIPF